MAKEILVVVLPWSAFGHMMPFFQLSIALAKSGVRVSFVSTPRNMERLHKIPSDLASRITLAALPLPKLPNGDLPEGAEATVDIPFEKIPQLKMAYDLLQEPFQTYMADHSPDWIIIDFMCHWVIDTAQESQIPVVYFSVFSSVTNVFAGPPEYVTEEGRMSVRPSMESLMSLTPTLGQFPFFSGTKMTLLKYVSISLVVADTQYTQEDRGPRKRAGSTFSVPSEDFLFDMYYFWKHSN